MNNAPHRYRHILRSQQFNPENIKKIFALTDHLKNEHASNEASWRDRILGNTERETSDGSTRRQGYTLQGKSALFFFGENSTRTRTSFHAACVNMRLNIMTAEPKETSISKGESWEDTVLNFGLIYSGVFIIRHSDETILDRAASVLDEWDLPLHIINAGLGSKQHPTQALLDVYTIERRLGHLDNLTIVIGGDLRYSRAVRSLVYLLAKYHARFIFVAHPELCFTEEDELMIHLREKGVSYKMETDVRNAFPKADVVYWTRPQEERWQSATLLRHKTDIMRAYTIDGGTIKLMKPHPDSILMHPFPRKSDDPAVPPEILPEVDHDPRVAYLDQVKNGPFVRAALLYDVLLQPHFPDHE